MIAEVGMFAFSWNQRVRLIDIFQRINCQILYIECIFLFDLQKNFQVQIYLSPKQDSFQKYLSIPVFV